jgi:hypothetical protein
VGGALSPARRALIELPRDPQNLIPDRRVLQQVREPGRLDTPGAGPLASVR